MSDEPMIKEREDVDAHQGLLDDHPSDPAGRPVLVPESRLEQLYDQTVSMQGTQARYWRISATRKQWTNTGLGLALTAAIVLILGLFPLTKYVPVFVYTNEAGFNETTTALSELPPTTRVAGIEALLWQYLRNREHYAPSEAGDSYNMVSAMSSQPVREQYQDWANIKTNKEAPAAKLGESGFIRVTRLSGAFISHSDDFSKGVYKIQFCRVVAKVSSTPMAQAWHATIAYQLVETLPLIERITNNSAGLVVTEYPGPEADEPQPHFTQPGSDHPCGR